MWCIVFFETNEQQAEAADMALANGATVTGRGNIGQEAKHPDLQGKPFLVLDGGGNLIQRLQDHGAFGFCSWGDAEEE